MDPGRSYHRSAFSLNGPTSFLSGSVFSFNGPRLFLSWECFLSMDLGRSYHGSVLFFNVPMSFLTYGPHKAVAEVSIHNEPIGRKSGIQLVRKSMDFTFSCFVLN